MNESNVATPNDGNCEHTFLLIQFDIAPLVDVMEAKRLWVKR